MKLNWFFINTYKNLEIKKIEFNDSLSNVYVLVGKNGSGKSNLLEALSLIFGSLYTEPRNPPFAYGIGYEIGGRIIEIELDPLEFSIKVDGENKQRLYKMKQKLYWKKQKKKWKRFC